MEFLKQWVMCICVSLIISVVFSSFTPKGNMKSFYKMMISLFIFLSFLYPLKDFDAKSFDFTSSYDFVEVDNINNDLIEQMITNKVINTLKQNNIIGASVKSDVVYKNNEIEIKSVSVAISDEYAEDEVKTIIFDNVGINAEVHKIGN